MTVPLSAHSFSRAISLAVGACRWKTRHKLAWAVLALAIIVPAFPSSAFAQLVSSQPIKIVVSLAPGGATDVGVRMLAKAYTEQTGQHVVVENRAGGGGAVAAMAVKQSAADGHTLVVLDNGGCCANGFLSNTGYDATVDFAPVLMLWGYPLILVVGADSPARSVADLVALARSKPEGLTYASQGVATGGHILGEMLAKAADVPLVHVPFRGAAPAATEVATGRVDMLFASYASVKSFIDDGRLRPLATTADVAANVSTSRLPQLPRMADAGFPSVKLDAWFMLLAPAATPQAVLNGLHSAFEKALRSPDVRQGLQTLQMQVPAQIAPADVKRRMQEEITMIAPIMKSIAQRAERKP